MAIRFLGSTTLKEIDELCRNSDRTEIEINFYRYDNGTNEMVQISGFGSTIRSSKDLFQFDNLDIKQMNRKLKHTLH